MQQFKTKTQLAVEGIEQAIFSGRLRPGSRVTLAELSKMLGVSITPIREAIRMLEATGLVASEPHRGLVINQLTPEDAEEVALLRAPMEALATRLAVPKLTPDHLVRLERLHELMGQAVAAGDDLQTTEVNAEWHFTICRAAQTRQILTHIERLWTPFYWIGFWSGGQRERSLADHDAIMGALRDRNSDLAAEIMEGHVKTAHLSIMDFLREQHTYDSPGSVASDDSVLANSLTR